MIRSNSDNFLNQTNLQPSIQYTYFLVKLEARNNNLIIFYLGNRTVINLHEKEGFLYLQYNDKWKNTKIKYLLFKFNFRVYSF